MLRPIEPADHPFLLGEIGTPGIGDRWRFQWMLPDESTIEQVLWDGVLEQRLIFDERSLQSVGLVSAYNADLRSGTAFLSLVAFTGWVGTGVAIDGAIDFVDHLFAEWPLRHVYLETYDYSLVAFASRLGEVASLAGVVPRATFWDGRWYDRHVYDIARSRWPGRRAGGHRIERFDLGPVAASSTDSADVELEIVDVLTDLLERPVERSAFDEIAIGDLELDSLEMLMLYDALDRCADHELEIELDAWSSIRTLGDLRDVVVARRNACAHDSPA